MGLLLLMVAGTAARAAALPLVHPRDLAPGSQALVRIAPPLTPALRRINFTLQARDQAWTETLTECGINENSRVTSVERNGPTLLSVTEKVDYFCQGAAHPNESQPSYTFNLASGALVDWSKLLPRSQVRTVEAVDDDGPGFQSPLIQADYKHAMRQVWDRAQRSECGSIFDGRLTFRASFDPKRPVLRIKPMLAHAVQACGEPLDLNVARLKALGAAAFLVETVAAVGANR